MTNFIILSGAEAWSLYNDIPVRVYVDQIPHVICTDEYYEKQRNEPQERNEDKK